MEPSSNGHLDLVARVYDVSRRRIKSWPCHTNRASGIGHDCERHLTYTRTAWADRLLHDVDLERIFAEGRIQEQAVMAELAAAGIEVIEQQRPIDDLMARYQISGHMDGVINDNGTAIVLEIKSMSDPIWSSVARRGAGVYEWSDVAEAFQSKPWLRKYFAQMCIYMLGKNTERGVLLLKNKSTGALAQVNMVLDFAYAESLLQRAERINAHIAAGTLPERMAFDDLVCGRCDWRHLCLPDMPAVAIAWLPDDAVAYMCCRREELDPARKEFADVDARVKAFAKAREEPRIVVCGDGEHGTWELSKNETKRGTIVSIRRVCDVSVA